MSSSQNLSDMFFTGGATTSQAVEATTESHFESTSFKLKRTRSLGLLDEFIPGKFKELFVQDDYPHLQEADHRPSSTNLADMATQEVFGNIVDIKAAQLSYTNLGNLGCETIDVPAGMGDLFQGEVVDMPEIVSGAYVPHFESAPGPLTAKSTPTAAHEENAGSSVRHTEPPIATPALVRVAPSPSVPDNPNADPFALLHDDAALVDQPKSHVDYLSHNWKESDISKSWRYIVLRRKAVANSARLENASWRTWAQAKYHLKTINPATVNWLKDSDVTWLYGPICKGATDSEFFAGSAANLVSLTSGALLKKNNSATDLDTLAAAFDAPQTKPILKRRTMQEILSASSYPASVNTLSINPNTPHNALGGTSKREEHGVYLDGVNTTYNNNYQSVVIPSNASSCINSPVFHPQGGLHLPFMSRDSLLSPPLDPAVSKAERHIHFNDRVEQCISVDQYLTESEDEPSGMTMHEQARARGFTLQEDESSSDSETDNEHQQVRGTGKSRYPTAPTYDVEEDSDDEGFFLNVRSTSSLSLHHGFVGLTTTPLRPAAPSSSGSGEGDSGRPFVRTIAPLPATTLKYGLDDEEDADDRFSMSHNQPTNRSGLQYTHNYDFNSVFVGDANLSVVDVPEGLAMDTLEVEIPSATAGSAPFGMGDFEDNFASTDHYEGDAEMVDMPDLVDMPLDIAGLCTAAAIPPPASQSSLVRNNSGFARTSTSNISGAALRSSNSNLAGSLGDRSLVTGLSLDSTASSASRTGSLGGFDLFARPPTTGSTKSFLLANDSDEDSSDSDSDGARPPSAIFRSAPSKATASPTVSRFNGSFTSDGDSSYASLSSIADRDAILCGVNGDDSAGLLLAVANSVAKDLASKLVGGWQ